MFLNKYSKSKPPATARKGTSFAQKGKGRKKKGDNKDSNKKKDSGGDKPKDLYKDMDCLKCRKKGHQAQFCSEKDNKNGTLSCSKSKKSLEKQFKSRKKSFAQLQAETVLSLKSLSDINLRLLDNQSTVSLFCNPRFTSSFSKAEKPLHLQRYGGMMTGHQVVEIGYG